MYVNRSNVLTRVIVGLFLIDEKPTSFVDKRTKDRHTLESSQEGSRLVTDLAVLVTRPMSLLTKEASNFYLGELP